MPRATSSFEIDSFEPTPIDDEPGAALGRVHLTKTFTGDLSGSSVVEMMTAMTKVEGSASYVAFERIDATIAGAAGPVAGTFVLQHNAWGRRGETGATWTVVPDSGTGGFEGISGTGEIVQDEEGHHTFHLDYELSG